MDALTYHETSPLASELRLDAQTIQAHFENLPGRLVSLKVARDENAHLAILLWSVDEHSRRNDLRKKLIHGDDLEIQFSKWPFLYLDEIRNSVQAIAATEAQGAFRQCSQSWDTIKIILRADQESLAARLRDQFGDAVQITVGNFPFPMDQSHRIERMPTPTDLSSVVAVSFPNLELILALSPQTLVTGQDGHGTVALRNHGATTIEFASHSPLVGTVLDPESERVVGGGQMAIAGVGVRISLVTEEEYSIPFIFATASSRIEEGYSLRPGQYLVKVQIPIEGPSPEFRDDQYRVISAPPATLTVTTV